MKLYQDKNWLQEQIKIYKTGAAIAKQFNFSEVTVQRYLKKYDLYLTQKTIAKDVLIKEYQNGLSPIEIANKYKLEVDYIWHLNSKYEISYLDYKEKKEYENKEWLEEKFRLFKTVTEVSRQTGYPRTCISRYAKKFNIYNTKYSRKSKNSVDENYFDVIDTEEKAYWLGFIMADGCMFKRKTGNYQFCIRLQRQDHNHLEKFKKAISFDGEIKNDESKRNNTVCYYSEIKIYNNKFCRNLIKHGIVPRKSGKEYLPKEIPQSLIKHFFRGFIDGDGSISGSLKRGKQAFFSICSSSKEIIDSFFEFNTRFNIKVRLYNNVYTANFSKKQIIYEALKYYYMNSNIYLDRKFNKANLLMLEYEKDYAGCT